ncbi:MAG TPA: dethiobiotin synthase [Methylibium sp.]|uniref:dethiobiotin synthase n=1 Tax=Methylibium sp. TaxID=2067992 RepID=UPI002DBC89F1|nr:dethiobiotin synthase [Methylibium sp.]HEU4458345.1 dethiobiotin synthase [Methylibium sp.]
MSEPARGWFVTGTDTGVGKSRCAVALLHALRARHARCVGMKPVAAGLDANGDNEDVLALAAAGTQPVPRERLNPYALPLAASPHVAAAQVGVEIDLGTIVRAQRTLAAEADAVVVEGAGGFLVPLSAREDGGDLAQALGLPIVLVVGLRLGCLNHALLTRDAIRARGLRLAGWVANRLDPSMPAQDENLAYLAEQLPAPRLADWPWAPALAPRELRFERLPD